MNDNLDDTHLCIKCNEKIVGLEHYIQHRKQECSTAKTSSDKQQCTISTLTCTSTTTSIQQIQTDVTPAITYQPFGFNEPEPPSQASHGGKTSRESYELPYELEADIFFSSLQLQSVQSTAGQHVPTTSGGKTGSFHHTGPITRQRSLQREAAANSPARVNWNHTGTSSHRNGVNILKEHIFKNLRYEHDSPEGTEDEEEEEEGDVDMDDDEDYDPVVDTQVSRGKWKLSVMRQSPPVVPISHTGGKWKPEHRPNLRVTHSQISRPSPAWDEHLDDGEINESQHPPIEHTKGKWLPGTKLQKLEYKETELAKCSKTTQDYWCNICCRKLKSKVIYENHLKSSFHLKRAEPELQLEKAAIEEIPKADIKNSLAVMELKPLTISVGGSSKKRKRRCTYLKCSLCKHVMARHLIGKHLISHYHYRRMQVYPGVSLPLILENIHAIVLQSPFQCRPCRFYANTEETFLLHWNSASHLDTSEGPGRFWCSYCQFECEDNNQMRRHLLGAEHKEVLLAINRSVPICISKRLSIDCAICRQTFRFNFELRRHFTNYHPELECMGTASDLYQSKFRCNSCTDVLPSKIALQRHEKNKHFITKYFCTICNMQFYSPCQARRHRKTVQHKDNATTLKEETKELFDFKVEKIFPLKEEPKPDDKPSTSEQAKLQDLQEKFPLITVTLKCKKCSFTSASQQQLRLHIQNQHAKLQFNCVICSTNFSSAQELGRHTRICKPTTIVKQEEVKLPTQLQEATTETGNKIWQCGLCDYKAPFQSEIIYHRVFHSFGTVSKTQLLPCPLCFKRFRKQSLRFHLHIHTNEKPYKCEICGSSFSRPYNLKDHIKNIHGKGKTSWRKDPKIPAENKVDKMFPCKSCDKVFKNKYSMKIHNLTHHVLDSTTTDDHRLHKCPHENCKYASVNKSLLKTHLNSHSMENFKCTEGDCSYEGKSKLHLKRHLQSHISVAEAKHFTCRECNFKTKTRGHLIRHVRLHTGEKPYSCPYCDFRSTTWDNLRKHILKTDKHVGKFVFECEKCKEELGKKKGRKESKIKRVFKTNSYQEYQHHLKTQHKAGKLPKLVSE